VHLCTSHSHRVGGWRPAAVLALCALGLATLTGRGRAQQAGVGTLRGHVIEAETSTPVRGAVVRLIPLPPGVGLQDSVAASPSTAYTDDGGEYAFRGVTPGRYRLDVSGLGYRSTCVWIDLPSLRLVRRSVALEVKPIELDPVEIVLSATAPKVMGELIPLQPGSQPVPGGKTGALTPVLYGLDTRVLDPAHLPQSGPFGEPDVFRALERFPGVSTRGDFSANLWTRGSPWGMTEILLDGLPLYNPLHLGGIAAGVAADGLESIDLLPGVRPPSAAEGAAGTIMLTTRSAGKRAASLGMSPLAVEMGVEDRVLDDRVGVAVTARRSWWDLFSPPAILAAPEARAPIDYHFADVVGHIDARLGSTTVLEGSGLWEEDRLHGDIADVVSSSAGRWGNRLGWLKLSRRFGRLRAEARLGRVAYRVTTYPLPRSAFLGPTAAPALGETRTSIDHTSLETSLHGSDATGHLSWDAGVELVHERLAQLDTDATARGLPGVQAPARLARVRAWTEATVRVGAFDVAGGVSLNRASGILPMPLALPSLRVRWSPMSWLTLEGARGKSMQFIYPLAPTGGSLGPALGTGYAWVIAGDTTPALVSDISTLAAEFSLPGGVFAQVVGWTRRVDGVWLTGVSGLANGRPDPVWWNENPFGGEHGRGLETRLGWRNRRLDVEAGYALGRSRFDDGTGSSWPSPAERRHSLDLHAQAYVTSTVDVGLDLTSETGWPLVVGPGLPCRNDQWRGCVDYAKGETVPQRDSFANAPRYESLDLRVRWTHQWDHIGLDLVGSVDNVFGRPNVEAFRASTCVGATLFSSVCEQPLGVPGFSLGLTRPTPSIAAKVRF
jgi:hypothetical protein